MKTFKKSDFPVEGVRRFLEPGPIALVSSMWKGAPNIMTTGWHAVMEFTPSLVGCIIPCVDARQRIPRPPRFVTRVATPR
jgi:flavin reductase (DIM6/NTAB) family NADH-FMN oxidoreductase RutF